MNTVSSGTWVMYSVISVPIIQMYYLHNQVITKQLSKYYIEHASGK